MPVKFMVFAGMTIGSFIGGYVPVFFGGSLFSFTSILTSGAGALAGIWAGYKLSQF